MSAQPAPETSAASTDFRDELGKAWAKHRSGHHEEAIEIFKSILQQDAKQTNALYGLGLAQRSKGDLQAAIDTFQSCLAEVKAGLAAQPGEDHYEMLQRMLEQRLSETRANTH